MTSPFPCSQCGLCCQHVNRSEETRFLDRGDGVCKHYNAAQKNCNIYHDRPAICRVDVMYQQRYQHSYTWEQFITINQQVCDLLQEQAGG